jgi:hypothetical protein
MSENQQDQLLKAKPSGISRRAMLKGITTSMPVVLTLQSGSALARSSNLISDAGYKATDRLGRTLCLDQQSIVDEVDGMYDLGEHIRVQAINERDYYTEANRGSAQIDEADLCRRGEEAYYKDSVLVSATALTSFAGSVDVIDI